MWWSGEHDSSREEVTEISTPYTPQPALRSLPDVLPPDNRTLGWKVLEWTADYLIQPDGPYAGQPWEFTREQAKIVLRWYAIDEHGRFTHRRGVIRRMKGWG